MNTLRLFRYGLFVGTQEFTHLWNWKTWFGGWMVQIAAQAAFFSLFARLFDSPDHEHFLLIGNAVAVGAHTVTWAILSFYLGPGNGHISPSRDCPRQPGSRGHRPKFHLDGSGCGDFLCNVRSSRDRFRLGLALAKYAAGSPPRGLDMRRHIHILSFPGLAGHTPAPIRNPYSGHIDDLYEGVLRGQRTDSLLARLCTVRRQVVPDYSRPPGQSGWRSTRHPWAPFCRRPHSKPR